MDKNAAVFQNKKGRINRNVLFSNYTANAMPK
jgi:hypothetical protein